MSAGKEAAIRQDGRLISDFTTGSIPKKLLRFSLPFMASNALQVFYAIVDMIVVGKVIGSAGLSAVSTASQLFAFMTMLCLGFCTGGQVLIAQLIGAGKKQQLKSAIGTLFTIMAVCGVVMTAAGLALQRQVLTLLNTPDDAYELAVQYMTVCSCGILFTYGYNVVSAILRGMGDARHPFVFIAIASVINVALDLLFVAVFNWGTAGAALATIIGQAFSFLYAVFFLARRQEAFYFDFHPASFRPDRHMLRALFSLGIPFALQSCAINISMMFVNSLVNDVGVNASAVFGVGVKIDDIANKVTQGLTFAGSAMVGQNFAAGRLDRVRRVVVWCWVFAAAAYAAFSALLLTSCETLYGFFTDDAGVVELAPVFVSAVVWSFPAMVLMRGTHGFIQGIGNAKLSLIMALIDGFVLRMFLSWFIGIRLGYGLYGFFFGFSMATYGTAVPAAIYFFSGVWKKRRSAVAKLPV